MTESSSSLFASGIRPTVDSYLLKLSRVKRDYGGYWSASSAGYCMRKVIFERLGVPIIETEDQARKQRVFTSGHIFHEWMQRITKEAGLSIAQELELQDEDLMIRGHIDDLVLVDEPIVSNHKAGMVVSGNFVPKQHLILYDYKTRNSKNFSFAKNLSHYHKMQLGTYMYMIRKIQDEAVKPAELDNLPLLVEGRILNLSKDDLRMLETQILWTPELEKEVVEYWTTLNGYWSNKKLPVCTCKQYEHGFLAQPKWNPYFYKGEPCSIEWAAEHADLFKGWKLEK